MPQKSEPAAKQQVQAFFDNLERELDQIEYFRPLDKRATMVVNLRNIFARMQPTRQDMQTLHGIVMALSEGRKGPARGGVLDGEEAKALRALLAEYGDGRVPGERSRCAGWRGCSAATRPRPSAGSGMRSPATGGLPAGASSARCRSARISPTSCRSRCGW